MFIDIFVIKVAPIFFDYPREAKGLQKMNIALKTFETYLEQSKTKYAAGDNVTLADFALVAATLCIEAIDYEITEYPLVKKWYESFKVNNPKLWEIAAGGMKELANFNKNPPNLSAMKHPFHPIRKN